MVEAVEEIFIPDVRVFVTIMNGQTDQLVLNPRYQRLADLSSYVANDEKFAV
jgi:hypothetical protein